MLQQLSVERVVTSLCPAGTGHGAASVGRYPAPAKESLHEGACVCRRETRHISDEVFTPSLPSSEKWSHEIPFLLMFRYGNAKHS